MPETSPNSQIEGSRVAVGKDWPSITETSHVDAKGLFLLFARGKRPSRAAIREFVTDQRAVSLTHDPATESNIQLVTADGQNVVTPQNDGSETKDMVWVELLRDGLTFDLLGLAPGKATDFPTIEHTFDLKESPSSAEFEALQLVPGHHLSGGENTMPIVRTMVALARDIVHHFDDLVAVIWPPSDSAIGRRFFESVSTAWLDGGAFPALGFVAFRETMDGALQTHGLEFWIDQEMRIEPPLSGDKVTATRLGVRLVNQLVIVGGIDNNERIVGPDGSRLLLSLSRNRKFVRVSRE